MNSEITKLITKLDTDSTAAAVLIGSATSDTVYSTTNIFDYVNSLDPTYVCVTHPNRFMWIRTTNNTIVFKPNTNNDRYFNLDGKFMVGDPAAYADVPTWLANSTATTTATTTTATTASSTLPDINTDDKLSTWLNTQPIKNVVYSWTNAETHIYVNTNVAQLFKFEGEFAKRESITSVTDPSVKTFINSICDCPAATAPASPKNTSLSGSMTNTVAHSTASSFSPSSSRKKATASSSHGSSSAASSKGRGNNWSRRQRIYRNRTFRH